MNKQEILDFITKNPVAYVATAEGNKPYVRPIGTYRADENGIIFSNKFIHKFFIRQFNLLICMS